MGGKESDATPGFEASLLASLERRPRTFEPKWFYDAAGSALFERICATEAYYVTRVERTILERHADDIAARIGAEAVLFEPGAGAARKARVLLHALERPAAYVPGDIDIAYLEAATASLREAMPALPVVPVELDFDAPFTLPESAGGVAAAGPVVAFFPGSTIGNFAPDRARALLARLADEAGATRLLIGFDLPPGMSSEGSKSEARLVRAYDDEDGVTAAFNLNLAARANRELDAGFALESLRHVARFDARKSRIEMYLESTRAQSVRLAGRTFAIEAGERLRTECSWKYSTARFDALAGEAGWRREGLWLDENEWFAVGLYRC